MRLTGTHFLAIGGSFVGVFIGLTWKESDEAWEREKVRIEKRVQERVLELKAQGISHPQSPQSPPPPPPSSSSSSSSKQD